MRTLINFFECTGRTGDCMGVRVGSKVSKVSVWAINFGRSLKFLPKLNSFEFGATKIVAFLG
jgi:hypothetical protein